MIDIQIDNAAVLASLRELGEFGGNPSPILKLIGEKLTDSTKRRFSQSIAPDGQRWRPNAQATYLLHLGKSSRNFNKDGKLSAKGQQAAIAKKPLIGETGNLAGTINYQLEGNLAVSIGSPMKYAAIHQLGGMAGRGRKVHIPARPFLGVSAEDEQQITAIIRQHIANIMTE